MRERKNFLTFIANFNPEWPNDFCYENIYITDEGVDSHTSYPIRELGINNAVGIIKSKQERRHLKALLKEDTI